MRRTSILVLLIPFSLAAAEKPFQYQAEISNYVQPYLEAEMLNAVSIGVVHGGQTWVGHFGQLSDQQAKPPHDQTIYEIGSISKVFTGLLLASAVEAGQVTLDQPIASLMPSLDETNQEVGQSITLRHLSTHNSGLPRMPDNLQPADPKNPYAGYDRDRLTAFMNRVRPTQKPNESTVYSNLAAGLLGDLLAARSKVSYEQLLKRTITKPLKMKDTTVTLSEQHLARVAPPHNEGLEAESPWDFDALVGAGGIRSTIPEMLKFIQANLDPPETELGRAIDMAWQQHVPPKDGYFAMGLGWHIARDGSTRWHNGQTGGYHSMLMINRAIRSGVIVLSNTATSEVDVIGESIIQMLAGIDVQPPEFAKVKKISLESMKRLVGKYKVFSDFVLDVRLKGDRLMVQATNQPSFRVYPESETRWKYRVVDAAITFQLPKEGLATALTLHQNGRDMRGPRIKDQGDE